MRIERKRVRAALALGALGVLVGVASGAATAKPPAGFITSKPAMLAPVAPGAEVRPLLTVGDTVGGYRFESIPDGIAVDEHEAQQVDIYLNHETSLVPFPSTRSDFTNALLSKLTLNRKTGGTLAGAYAIPNSANYQRFCSNFLVSEEQGFKRDLVFTNEEARDWVNRTGLAWPATPFAPGAEQAGVVVAYDVETGAYRSIYGLGRYNHENAVALPKYHKPVILSGDDTFDAPASQLYLYTAKTGDDVWNDKGRLYAFVSDDPTVNDYGDLHPGESVVGHFIEVPRMIATGKKLDGSEVRAADFGFPAPPSTSIPDGPQWVLEYWSNNVANAFQFIRIEDIAYDRHHENVVYLADTGEPRAIPDATTGKLSRGPSGTTGPYPNGRIFRLVLDKKDPLEVESLSILPGTDFDAGGYNNADVTHQPDNLETTDKALLITEDPGSHNQYSLPAGPGKTSARVWRYDLKTGALDVVLRVDQSSDPTGQKLGNWESSGIVDASHAFGKGMFLIDVQGHGWEIDTQINPSPPNYMRENGQLLLVKIPGT
jgi:hypothetical protein